MLRCTDRCLDFIDPPKFEGSKSGVPAKVALRICTTEIGKEEPATEPLNASPMSPSPATKRCNGHGLESDFFPPGTYFT